LKIRVSPVRSWVSPPYSKNPQTWFGDFFCLHQSQINIILFYFSVVSTSSFSTFPAFFFLIDRLSNLTIGTGIICKI
ncbi:MAG: hypothetical protein RSE38_13815, partial [Acinetobacter sp.]